MTEEIKKILDGLSKKASIYKMQINEGTSFNTDEYEANELLNYIINLQKENLALARENEQEKQFIKDCGFENTQQLALEYIGLREEKEDYKQKNEKATQYIDSLFNTIDYDDEEFITFDTLKDIQDLINYGSFQGGNE